MAKFHNNVSLQSNKITNLADGTASTDAVNKGQLDTKENALPSKTGNALKVVRVNAGETAFEYTTISTSEAWPVGSVFISVVSTNPNTLLGYGTWTAFATGRTLVGIDTGQTEFDTVEETGGAKTHTLTVSEMPSHTHKQNPHSHGITDPGHTHNITTYNSTAFGTNIRTASVVGGAITVGTASNTTGITVNNTTPENQNTGGDVAHNNLQPYIVVYM
jgi:microcystin-dependent protein